MGRRGPQGALGEQGALRNQPELRAPAPPEIHDALAFLAATWGCSRQEAVREAIRRAHAAELAVLSLRPGGDG